MGIIAYILLGFILALICWAILKFFPNLPAPWPTAIPTMAVILWVLLGFLIVFGGVSDYPMPRLR